MKGETEQIKISKEIINKIAQRLPGTEFKSVEEYINYVLEEVVKDSDNEEPEETFSEEDEQKVKERLRALGYLD